MTIDCLPLYAGLPSVRLASLEGIQRSAARLTGKIPKFGHVTGYLLEVLRWFPLRLFIEYRVASLVWRCQLFIPLIYLTDPCRVLRVIASCALLEGVALSPACSHHSHGRPRFFSGPTVWNGFSLEFRLLSMTFSDIFCRRL